MTEPIVGTRASRSEDRSLLTGEAGFIADLRLPGMLHAVMLRSPVAHAHIIGIDTSAAEALDGVIAVFTAEDIHDSVEPFTRMFYRLTPEVVTRSNVELQPYFEPVMASDRVRRVGEIVAMVVATDRHTAEDALELIEVDYDLLEPVTDPEKAMEAGSPQLHNDVPNNVHGRFRIEVGDAAGELENSARRVQARFRIARSIGVPLETRGVAAQFDRGTGELTTWTNTQIPHQLRRYMAEMLHLAEGDVRVIAPQIGGSFGGGIYAEEMLAPFAAMRLGTPVLWLEDRRENLANSRHSRDQIIDAALGFSNDGTIRALQVRIVQDCGAYNFFGLTLPLNVAAYARSVYRIDHYEAVGLCVLTNKHKNTPVRGAGRPEATFVIDRLIDMAAHEIGLDPADMREINLILAEEIPKDMGMLYRDGNPMVYDSGDFPDQFAAALDAAGYRDFRARQQELRSQGRHVGIGISCHVEGTGIGPHEGAVVEIDATGRVTVKTGATPQGQSHATTLAQVCADALGAPFGSISIRTGDTALISHGGGTFGSRSAVTAGSAVHQAATKVREKLVALAAEMLEANPQDLVVEAGRVHPRGIPDLGLTFSELALAAAPGPASRIPEEMEPGLAAESYFVPPAATFGSGTHIAQVEVDPDTGQVRVLDYTVVADSGQILNPMVVDGQQHGGVAHGIGNALLEEARYGEDGQFLTGTFLDYLLPTAMEVPRMRILHRPHPTPLNPMGVKGAGEGATASAVAVVANAIVDALRPLDVRITELPIPPSRLVELISEARDRFAS
ncbi:MAG: xanthine dehydrogenase family protein molybdopterin-binding subunit [Acidimicrobiia bacterium]|nr:xanthine dehydrogenase family protein molybdopterin-binding subunit [Acidimicrobiia bacterium]